MNDECQDKRVGKCTQRNEKNKVEEKSLDKAGRYREKEVEVCWR
jgi:hypothetical protein